MTGRRNAAALWTIVVLAVLAGMSIVPTSYYLIAPGSAVELAGRITVRAHRAPARRYYLTDVTIARASVLLLAGRLLPGTRVVRRETVLPARQNARSHDRMLVDAMDDSQNVAAVVAERAAGYRIDVAPPRFIVGDFAAASRARGILRSGDRILRIGGRAVRGFDDVARAVRPLAPGAAVRLTIGRDGVPREVVVPTIASAGPARLGIFIRERDVAAKLPVPVRFDLGDISGSSGGLMFALQIYAALHGGPAGDAVAGTGTLAPDGRVGRIEGTPQKLIAAKRAGARVFLVPVANYGEISGERDVRIVPVANFADALRAIGG